MAKRVTNRELQRICQYWQKRLRLTDWELTIRFASLEELPPDSQACVLPNLHARTADIMVLEPKAYEAAAYGGRPQDIENSVCHELLHLHLAPWETRNKAAEIQQEQAIESITGALVGLKRRTK